MVAFIAAAMLIVGVANMGFEQGQSNPDANNFFASKTHIADK